MSSNHYIFVYGTLRSDYVPSPTCTNPGMAAFLKKHANHIDLATIKGKLFLVEPNRQFVYPALSFSATESEQIDVKGDVFKLKEEISSDEAKLKLFWEQLDGYEGSEYERRIHKVLPKSGGGSTLECNVYEYVASTKGMKVITNGDFLNREVSLSIANDADGNEAEEETQERGSEINKNALNIQSMIASWMEAIEPQAVSLSEDRGNDINRQNQNAQEDE